MIDQLVYECQICFPSLEKAARRVPEEFLPCWRWFQQNEGQLRPLPYGNNRPAGMPIPLAITETGVPS